MAGVELFPKEYGYVILVRVFYCFLKFWMSFQVGKARKKYKLSYPTMYAIEAENKNAKLFNCVQVCSLFLERQEGLLNPHFNRDVVSWSLPKSKEQGEKFLEGRMPGIYLETASLPQGRAKVCVHTTLPRSH